MPDLAVTCTCNAFSATLRGLTPKRVINRLVCYCRDCQAFAHHLHRQSDALDGRGGTRLFQTQPHRVEIARGREQLATLRLSNRGPLRWFATCCNTPLCNTLPTRLIAFVSLIERPGQFTHDEQATLGPVRGAVFHKEAKDGPDPALPTPKPYLLLAPTLGNALGAFVTGRYKRNAFFTSDGRPIAEPIHLTAEERSMLHERVRAA
ncbi:MAG: DUF6151 family protein [Pseudomonadota bacterium]